MSVLASGKKCTPSRDTKNSKSTSGRLWWVKQITRGRGRNKPFSLVDLLLGMWGSRFGDFDFCAETQRLGGEYVASGEQ